MGIPGEKILKKSRTEFVLGFQNGYAPNHSQSQNPRGRRNLEIPPTGGGDIDVGLL